MVVLVPDSPYGLCGRKATPSRNSDPLELCRGGGGRLVPDSPYGLCGRKATPSRNSDPQRSGAVPRWRWSSSSRTVPTVTKQHRAGTQTLRDQELCRGGGGRPRPRQSLRSLWTTPSRNSDPQRSGAVPRWRWSSSSRTVPTVSVDVKQHSTGTQTLRAQELCENRGGRPGLSVHKKPYCFCGRKATVKKKKTDFRV